MILEDLTVDAGTLRQPAPVGRSSPKVRARARSACRCPTTCTQPADQLDVRVLAERLGMPLVADDAAPHLVARSRDRGDRPRAHHRGRARARAPRRRRQPVPALDAARPEGAARRVGVVVRLSLRPARVAGTARPNCIPQGLEIVDRRARRRPGRGAPVHRAGRPAASVAHRLRARRRRAVRHRERAQRRLDRRGQA